MSRCRFSLRSIVSGAIIAIEGSSSDGDEKEYFL
jgi:hypothetical protein